MYTFIMNLMERRHAHTVEERLRRHTDQVARLALGPVYFVGVLDLPGPDTLTVLDVLHKGFTEDGLPSIRIAINYA
jgi:hypothetical protein